MQNVILVIKFICLYENFKGFNYICIVLKMIMFIFKKRYFMEINIIKLNFIQDICLDLIFY